MRHFRARAHFFDRTQKRKKYGIEEERKKEKEEDGANLISAENTNKHTNANTHHYKTFFAALSPKIHVDTHTCMKVCVCVSASGSGSACSNFYKIDYFVFINFINMVNYTYV